MNSQQIYVQSCWFSRIVSTFIFAYVHFHKILLIGKYIALTTTTDVTGLVNNI